MLVLALAIAATPNMTWKDRREMAHEWRDLVYEVSEDVGIDPKASMALIYVESAWDPMAVSNAGAIGFTQLMPGTAEWLGVDPWNPEENIRGGLRFFGYLYRLFGNYTLAWAAYNAGPGRVRSCQCIPPYKETIKYVSKLENLYKDPMTNRKLMLR